MQMDLSAPAGAIADQNQRLGRVPVSLFSAVMGLSALSLAWRSARTLAAVPSAPATLFGVAAVVAFAILAGAYAYRTIQSPAAVRSEFADPVTRNFFGMPFISLLLLAVVIAPISRGAAVASWTVGAAGISILASILISGWLIRPPRRATVTTAWLITAVGILDIPLAMPVMSASIGNGFGMACVAFGLVLAALLYAVIVPRYLFEPPPPRAQTPTLLIAAAPLAVGCSSYMAVAADTDGFAQALLALATILLAALLIPVLHYFRASTFSLTWWGTGFPVAAAAGAAMRYAAGTHGPLATALAWSLLILATLLISGLLLGTLIAAFGDALRRGRS